MKIALKNCCCIGKQCLLMLWFPPERISGRGWPSMKPYSALERYCWPSTTRCVAFNEAVRWYGAVLLAVNKAGWPSTRQYGGMERDCWPLTTQVAFNEAVQSYGAVLLAFVEAGGLQSAVQLKAAHFEQVLLLSSLQPWYLGCGYRVTPLCNHTHPLLCQRLTSSLSPGCPASSLPHRSRPRVHLQ
jgi:hypothetical protein